MNEIINKCAGPALTHQCMNGLGYRVSMETQYHPAPGQPGKPRLSWGLVPLGIMGDQFWASLKPVNTRVP